MCCVWLLMLLLCFYFALYFIGLWVLFKTVNHKRERGLRVFSALSLCMCVCCRVVYFMPVCRLLFFYLFCSSLFMHTGKMMGDFWVPSKNFNGTFLLFLLSLLLVALFLLPVAAVAALLVAPLAAAFIEWYISCVLIYLHFFAL